MSYKPEELIIGNITLCLVEEGEFLRGSTSTQEEYPPRQIFLTCYKIGKYPIMNKDYLEFVRETNYRIHPTYNNKKFNGDLQPVVAVNWYDACEYCKWFSDKYHVSASLPTEAQWEKASRGVDGKTYPWGNSAPTSRIINVNSYIGKTTDVGNYENQSDYGCYDMLGNIWEWCDDYYDENYYANCPVENPHNIEDGRYKSIRGGSWRSDLFRATCAHRCFYNPNIRSDRHGFRIVIN